ncbi:MAG: tetratricopeptide repeat protein [Proteobacteria bacterium]|nr:tetratricopeptide repeat protein [Pseudomonadota bacterium]
MSLIVELKRRNVFRVAAAYLVVGWLLTEVLTTILPTLGAPDWISRAIILIFAFGFIPAVILSWVYELTPEGVKREHEVVRDESITGHTAKKLDYVTIAAVIAGIIFFAFFSAKQFSNGPPEVEAVISDASVAVLPFENLSADADHEYFSNGLTETILHMLAQIPDLKVAARTSSFAFRDQNKTVQEIAAALGVAHILEGSVQRDGDQVRITAQLIRADDGFHVWSENYDRTLDDIFGIQDEIAEKVGGALSASLLGAPVNNVMAGINTRSPDAYDLYLQAINERDKFSHGGLLAAEGLLKGALTIDPDFLDAKTELANNYLQQVETGLMEADDAFNSVLAITNQVLAASPDDVGARAIKLFTETQITMREGDPAAGLDAFDLLQELIDEDPSALQPRIFLNRMLRNDEQIEQALTGMLEALHLDPFNPRIHYELGNIYSGLEQWDDARAALKKSLELEPAQPNAYVTLAGLSLQKGDGLDYLQLFLAAMAADPVDHELPGMIAMYLYRLELVEEGDDFRNRVMAIAPTSEISYRLELLRAMATGDEDAGIASARRAIEDDIEDRRFSFGGAALYLLRVAAARGTVAEESAYLEAQAPGILDIEATSVPSKYRVAQISAFDAWYTTLSKDELYRRIDYLREIIAGSGVDLSDNPQIEFATLALRGEVEQAIEVALEHLFSEPVALNLDWEENLKQAQYAEIIEDPRIQAAMKKWQDDEDALREQIRTYLADLYASS